MIDDAKFDAILSQNGVSPQGGGDWYSQLSGTPKAGDIGAPKDTTPPPPPNTGQLVANQWQESANKIGKGMEGTNTAGQQLTTHPIKALEGLAGSTVDTAQGILQAIYAPFTALAQKGNQALGGAPEKTIGFGKDILNTAYTKPLTNLMQGWVNDHPDAADALIKGLQGVKTGTELAGGVAGLEGMNTPISASEGASAYKNAIKESPSIVKGAVTPKPETPSALVGKITQATPEEIPTATRGLSNIDTSGVKTFEDLSKKLDTTIKANQAKVDTEFGKNTQTYTPDKLNKVFTSGETSITHNFVSDALDQLATYYEKTSNPGALAKIKALQAKFTSEGLTPTEINNIAREHGSNLNAYNASGQLASGLSKQAAENTRTGVKTTARDLMSDKTSQVLDKQTSDLIKTKDMIDEMNTKVQALQNKFQKAGFLQKVGGFAGKAIDFTTGGFLKGLLKTVTGMRAEGQTLNALELQNNLAKNLSRLDKALKMSPQDAATELENLSSGK